MVINFKTQRLTVSQLVPCDSDNRLLQTIVELLTPEVVKNLPAYFSDINSVDKAKAWLDTMLSESRLLSMSTSQSNVVIGFMFIYDKGNGCAQIGYLLGQRFWRQGYASELLQGFINCFDEKDWRELNAGVSVNNEASCNLLLNLGFTEQQSDVPDMRYYQYIVNTQTS